MLSTIVEFSVDHCRFIDPAGNPCGELPAAAGDRDLLVRLYRAMVLTRTFDAKAVALQRTGRLGTFPSSLGQEAVVVGMAAAMHDDDIMVPTFRDQGAQFIRGVTPAEILLYWGGDERGSAAPGAPEDFPICVPVGTHAPHAAGVALALQLRVEQRAVLCSFGDGATSKGDVYEAMNLAGIWRLPLVFVVSNNQWAISVSRNRQTAAQTLAQKAIGCGFSGQQVDGNDVLAVYSACSAALARAREGQGPQLIEALTYRLTDHTTADDAGRYRDDREVSEHWKLEPVSRFRRYLQQHHHWQREEEEQLIVDCEEEIDQAVEEYLDTPPLPPESLFDCLYETLPEDVRRQRRQFLDKE